MTHRRQLPVLAAVTLIFASSAGAWGPNAQVTLIDFALNLLSEQGNLPLKERQREIRDGARVSSEQVLADHPDLADNPVRVIESEMALLQQAGRNGFDTYYAYRLGILGKLVLAAVAPMSTAPPMFRDRYESDVEASIDKLRIQTGKRVAVEPRAYFAELVVRSSSRDELIMKDYQNGIGFDGVAKTSLAGDAGRAVDAIADVWHTLLTSRNAPAAVSEAQLRRYVLGAYAFYIARGNASEIEAAAQRLEKLAPATPDMRVQMGDLFYDAEMYERAMQEYLAVLAVQPDRKEVVERISEYYVQEGDRFLEDGALEKALASYSTAADANPLHPSAQAKRLDVEKLIRERDTRHENQLNALNQAAGLEAQSAEHAMNGFYAEATAQLLEANMLYEGINNEFPDVYAKATRGLRDNTNKIQELRQGLIGNALQLSGTGFAHGARSLASIHAREMNDTLVQSLVKKSAQAAFEELESEVAPKLVLK